MSTYQRVIAGFIGLIVCILGGVISSETRFDPGQFLALLGGILFIVGIYKSAFSTRNQAPAGDPEAIQRLESRMTDVQEIILSMDDRLKRLENQDSTKEQTP